MASTHWLLLILLYYWLLQLKPVGVESNIERAIWACIQILILLCKTPRLQCCKKDFCYSSLFACLLWSVTQGLWTIALQYREQYQAYCDFPLSTTCIITAVTNVRLLSSAEPSEHSSRAYPGRKSCQADPKRRPVTDEGGRDVSAGCSCVASFVIDSFCRCSSSKCTKWEDTKVAACCLWAQARWRWRRRWWGGRSWNDHLCVIRPQIWFCAYTSDPNAVTVLTSK